MTKKVPAIPDEFQEKLKELTPEQAAMFVHALDLAMRKRKMMLLGYVGALLALLAGIIVCLLVYADHTPGTFIGWIFLLPALFAGLILWGFGKLTKRIGK